MFYAIINYKQEQEKEKTDKEKLTLNYKDFSQDFGYIVFFVLMALFITVFFKEKVLFYFLLLVLIGMMLVNANKITSLLYRYMPK